MIENKNTSELCQRQKREIMFGNTESLPSCVILGRKDGYKKLISRVILGRKDGYKKLISKAILGRKEEY